MRKSIIAAIAVAVIGAGAGLLLLSSVDDVVKAAITDVGSRVTGTKVAVAKVKISLADGKGSVSGLQLANPPGFSDAPAISLGDISLSLDKASVTGNPVVVKELRIAAPAIRYEIGANGSNLDLLRKSLAGAKSSGNESRPASGEKTGRKLVIERLIITQGQVALAVPGLTAATAKLGDIELSDIGRNSGGADARQIAEEVMQALLNNALNSAASANLAASAGKIGEQLKELLKH
jgi:hypothetical protein